jgi:K+-sensing histidine kinase KdpD
MAGLAGAAQYLALTQEMALFIFFALLVISWQYNFRIVAISILLIGLLDFSLTFFILGHNEMTAITYERTAFSRTASFLAVGYIISHLMKEQRAQRQSLQKTNTELAHYAATLE